MRPRQVIWFERIMLVTVAASLVQAAVGWQNLVVPFQGVSGNPKGIAALVLLLTLVLVVLLTLLASRRRNLAALVLLTILYLGGAPDVLRLLFHSSHVTAVTPLALANFAVQGLALALTATAPARRWFAARGEYSLLEKAA